MPAPDNQSANWRFNSNGALANPDFLADDVARLSLSSDVSKPFAASSPDPGNTSVDSSQTEGQDAHSRNSSSGAGRLNIQADASSESTTSRSQPDRKEQPNYPSLSNGQRAPQKSHSGQANGRGRGAGFGTRTNQYRSAPQQIQVGMPGQGIIPSPTALGYPGAMSLGTPQQLYDMMGVIDPNAISRLQQSNIRGNHQHSGSDHDVNVQQSFNNAMFAPQLSAGLSMYSNQFFANQSQEAYRADLASQAQAMLAARLQQQYPPYPGSPPVTGSTDGAGIGSPSSSSGGNGPSANNRKLGLYKTELCRSWEEKHTCRYGTKCQFAHGEDELRNVSRHPKYKTEICRTFWVSGSCPYGKRCCFIHTELPHGANANGSSAPQSQTAAGSNEATPQVSGPQSNISDNEAPKSLLARITTSQKTGSNPASSSPTPVESSASPNFPFARPGPGSLRLDTKSLDSQAYKTQNKSAFPVFPNANGRSVQPAPEPVTAMSPLPVTAGPDFGRHAASRKEIVGVNRNGAATPTGGHSYSNSTEEGTSGHQRTASSGAWRNANNANYNASPAGEPINSPWTTQELVTGTTRQRPW